MSRGRVWLMRLTIFGSVAVSMVGLLITLNTIPKPSGQSGAKAEAMAARMLKAVDAAAWKKTGALAWTFAGRHQHLWDKGRGLAQVTVGDTVAFLDLATRKGLAQRGGAALEGDEGQAAVTKAYALWVNDSFWLNPVVKMHDEGVRRSLVGQGLLIEYSSGGLTPGDAYLWQLDNAGRPASWRMWTATLPVDGFAISWTGWQQLETGAWVSTRHGVGPLEGALLSEVRGAVKLSALAPGPDPFAALLASVR